MQVLFTCELSELKPVMQMSFGDWELFRTLVIMLREKEASFAHLEEDDVSSGGSNAQPEADDVEPPKNFDDSASQADSDVTPGKCLAASVADVMKKPKPQYVAGASTVSAQSLDAAEARASAPLRRNIDAAVVTRSPSDAQMTSSADAEVTSLIIKQQQREVVSSDLKRKDSMLDDVMHEATCLRHLVGDGDFDEEEELFEEGEGVSTQVRLLSAHAVNAHVRSNCCSANALHLSGHLHLVSERKPSWFFNQAEITTQTHSAQ